MEQLNHQTTKLPNHQTCKGRMGHMRQTGLAGQLGRWAAVAAVAAGAWLSGAREAWAWGSWGDTVNWKGDGVGTNWNGNPNSGSPVWWHSGGWNDYLDESTGGRCIRFDNNKELNQGNNLSAEGATNRWQIWFDSGASSTHTIRGTAQNHFYDNGGAMPKIENQSAVEQRIWFPIAIGNTYGMEVNPVKGDLSLTNVHARGHAMNVYGDGHKLRINGIWYAGSNTANTAASTLYVDGTSDVYVKEMRGAGSKYQTINVNASGGRVAVSNLYTGGTAIWKKEGAGELVVGGASQASGTVGTLEAAAGTLVLSNFTGTATTRITLTNLTLTNSSTVVMKSPARFRRVSFNTGATVEMDVFDNSTAAKLGIDETLTTQPDNMSCVISYGGRTSTLKLMLTSGFDPTENGSFIVYEGRNQANSMSGESAGITLQTVDLVGGRTLGTFALREGKNSRNSANLTAIWVDYTKPATAPELSNPTATVTGTTTATLGATVDRNNGLSITDYGIVYSKTATEPTVGGTGCTKAQKGTTTPTSGAAWTLNVTGLEAGTTYYYRGYATSSAGTGYSTVGTFTTLANQSTAVSVTQLTHTFNGNTITLVGTGGNGTGTAVYTFGTTLKTGTTGTGSLTSAGVLTVEAAGDFVFDVTRAASGSYAARTDEVTVTVNKGNQTISGLSNVTKTYGDGTFSLSASSSAGLTVSYSISPSSVATVSGSTVTIAGAGTATITASQAGNGLWNAATAVTATLTVNKKDPTVTASVSPATIRVGGTATLTGSTDSGATLTFATSSSSIASLSGSGATTRTVTGAGYGTATLTVNSPATANYNAGSATCTITVLLAKPTAAPTITGTSSRAANSVQIDFNHPTTSGYGNGTFILMRAGSSITATPTDGSGAAYKAVNNSSARSWSGTQFDGAAPATYVEVNSTVSTRSFVKLNGLTAATHYYVVPYGYNSLLSESTTAADYTADTSQAYSAAGSEYDFWTLATQPGTQASSASATPGSRKATLTWTAGAMPSGGVGTLKYLVVVRTSGTQTAPDNGQTYAAGATLGPGTVAYAGVGTVDGSTVSCEITGLTPETSGYKVTIYAYAEGDDPTTAHYRTGSPATVTFATIASQGPAVQATGVDTTGYLLNWSQLSSDSAGYDVDTRASGGNWSSAGTALPGYNKPVTGLTSGSTYEARVRKNPDGDWSDELSVKAGVKPNTVSSTATRNSVTFTWTDVQSGAVGYGVQVTKTAAAASLYTKTCPSSALGRNSFSSGQQWKYTGDQITCTSQYFATSPGYRSSYGHIIIGAGQTLESDAFALDGMTALQLKFTINVHNSTSGTDDCRVNAYYKINGGVWNWLGTANTATAHTLTVPQGAIDEASTIAFKLVAPNAHVAGNGGSFVCPAIDSISVKATAKGSGDYDSPVTATTTSSRSYTVSGLTAGETVYFRVQALQGSTANPTAKSVWVEATETSSAYTPPSGLTLSAVTRNSMTATWTAGNTYQLDHYVVEWSTSSSFASLAGSANVAAGTVTYGITGLTASTKYYVRVKAVGTDSQSSAYCTSANATTLAFSGPVLGTATSGRNWIQPTWTAADAGSGVTGYEVQWTTCAGSGTPVEITGCVDGASNAENTSLLSCVYGASAGAGTGTNWAWRRKSSGVTYPRWTDDTASTRKYGHCLMPPGTNSVTPSPALVSPVMDLTGYTDATIEFTHWARNVSYTSHSDVTLYYSTDGGSSWTESEETRTASSGTTTTPQSITLPAAVQGRSNVALMLVAKKANAWKASNGLTYYTGAMLKDVKVKGVPSVGGDYDDCATKSSIVPVTGRAETSKLFSGLESETYYYFRVRSVAGEVKSDWSDGGIATTAFGAPTGFGVTDEDQYTLATEWDAFTEPGLTDTVTYEMMVTACALPGSGTADCPNTGLEDGTDADEWTYQRGIAGDGTTASSYPRHNGVGHLLLGQYSSEKKPGDTGYDWTKKPGIETPTLDLGGAESATLTFKHWAYYDSSYYTNTTTFYKNQSNLKIYKSVDGGAWADTGLDVAVSTGTWSGGADTRTVTLPASLRVNGLKLRIIAPNARSVKQADADKYEALGAVVKDVKVSWSAAGGGDFSCDADGTFAVRDITDIATASKLLENLPPATTFYLKLRTVLKSGGVVTARSAWTTASGTTLAGQNPPLAVWADPVKQTQMKILWDAVEGATRYEVQMTRCEAREWETTVAAASPTNARFTDLDDWVYVGGGTDVEAVEGVKLAETGLITAGGFYPTFADGHGTGTIDENSQALAGEGEPGMQTKPFSTVGATNGVLSFNFARWYAKNNNAAETNASVLTVSYSTDGGESWAEWFKTESAYTNEYTRNVASHTGPKTVSTNLPAAAMGHEQVCVKLVAENAGILSVNGNLHAVGAAVALAKVTLQGVAGDYDDSGDCRADDGTWFVDADEPELSVLVTELDPDTQYYFRVRATDMDTESATLYYGEWTDGAAKTLAVPDKPATPTASNIGRYAMTINWTETARAETYTLMVYNDSGTLLRTITGIEGLSYRLTSAAADGSGKLTPNTYYKFSVTGVADGQAGTESDKGRAQTLTGLAVVGLKAQDIDWNGMTVVWESAGTQRNTLTYGPVGAGGSESVEEVLECPAETLKRTDSGNEWFYMGGSASFPAYWSGSAAGDEGHALIYNLGGAPAIRSRWFDTLGATNVVVEFLHGRFNQGADSTVELDYSLDGGATWTYAGEAASTSASTPNVERKLTLPAAALNRKSVMIQLSAPGANGNKGAHVKNLKIRIQGSMLAQAGSYTYQGGTVDTVSQRLSLSEGTRYWFKLEGTDDGSTTAAATNTAATYVRTTGVLASQGFESGSTDTTGWTYTTLYKYYATGNDAGSAAAGTERPVVEVVENENPLYGRRSLRMSGSREAAAHGIAEFTYRMNGKAGFVTVPFSAKDLKLSNNLYFAYAVSPDNSTWTWHAPATNVMTFNGTVPMTAIGIGGSDVINQNWPYNHKVNTKTRPYGGEFTCEVPAAQYLKVWVSYCGQSGGAESYYYIDELKLEERAGTPDPVSATANDNGHVTLTWTAPADQRVIIIRGQDMREPPSAGAPDLSALPDGYSVVTNTGASPASIYFPAGTGSRSDTFEDLEATSGWRYFYYFYAVTESGTIGKTPGVAQTMVRGMVHAIASQGWDGWDAHPWGYKKGRVTNPGRSSDDGYWKAHGMNSANVAFIEGEYETDTAPARAASKGGTPVKVGDFWYHWVTNYATLYGEGAGANDPERTDQLGKSSLTNYYGTNSFRLSGGGGTEWRGNHVFVDWSGNTVTNTNPYINTNNAAIQFENIDLSGYRNVEFQMHYAGKLQGGGNYMHLAISTNGPDGPWEAIHNKNSAMWCKTNQVQDYGLQLQEMSNKLVGEKVDFYDQRLAQYGNPFILHVPDTVTQFMARVMFYDSNGRSMGWRYATYFIDEVRLLGDVAMEAPHPVITQIGENQFTVSWNPVPKADRYNVKITATAAAGDPAVKLNEAFVAKGAERWTANGNVSYPTTANRQGGNGTLGYGLSLGGEGAYLESPELGGIEEVTFWASGTAGAGTLAVMVGDEVLWEETCTNIRNHANREDGTKIGTDGNWTQYRVALPHRQWQTVKFVKSNSSTGNPYVDDVSISGSGSYTGAGTLNAGGATTTTASFGTYQTVTNLTATEFTFTGLGTGTRYFVEVQAVDEVTDASGTYELASVWKDGETADYTAGHIDIRPDGFEMVRMWGTASSSVDVLIASSTGDAPIGTPAVGTTYSAGDTLPGGGTVVARWTGNYTENNNFEHVVPANAQVNYAVFWKRGAYYEGRYDTNFWMGKYGSPVADAFAQTNGIAPVSFVSSGAGWSAGGTWSAWDDSASYVSIARGSSYPFGLLGSNQLFGAGGDMIKFDMGTAASELKVRVGRDFATPFAGTETWFMFTVRCQHGADDINKMWGMQLLSETGSDAYKSVIASIGKIKDLTGTTGEAKLSVDTSSDTDGTWLGGGYPLRTAVTDSSYGLKDYGHSGNTNAIYTIVGKYVKSTGKLSVKAYYTPTVSSGSGGVFGPKAAAPTDFDISNVSATANKSITGVTLFGYGWNGNLYFDEIRFGPSWSSLIEEPSPPKPVTAVRAIPDGKELVRLDWTYAASDPDYPDAEGVLVLDKATPWTAEDIAAAKPVNGQPYNVGTTIGGATVAYLGEAGWTVSGRNYQDLVVEPGSTHYYRVYAHSSYMYTNGVAASGTAPSQYPVTMETYRTGEHVVPFSYTNASTTVGSWQGGAGFTGGWTGTGTWTAMLPLEQPGSNPSSDPVLADVTGYPARAGNAVMVTDPGNGGTATLTRALDTAVTASKTNFYAAFMMAYEWKGSNKWAGVSILNGSDQEIGFAGKGSGANWNTLAVASDLTPHWSQTDLLPYDPSNADSSGALSHAYLVVMRYNFANRTLSALAVPCGGEMPEYEPTQWDVSWQVREGLGSSVAKIQLNVGSSDPGGTIGYCWFDELRWGTRWDDIVSGKCADSIPGAWWRKENSTENLEETYLGNSGTFLIRSTPTGFGQEAWLTIDWTGGASAHTVTTNQLAWLTNETVSGVTYTWWSNKVQLVEVGEVGGVNASADWPATAKVTALNADCVAVSETTRLTVTPLGAPTGVTAAKNAVKTNSVIDVSWTPWTGTLTGVDTHTKDVLVVRFTGSSSTDAETKAALAANQPVQGRAYSAGDSIGEGTVVWRGGDEGRVRTTPAKGLMPNTWYAFAVYTENYSYYSTGVIASAKTDEGGHTIDIDGDPVDWYGEAPDTLNTSWVNLGEFIWKDKTGEERHSAGSGDSTVGNPNSDIDEFRIYADADWVYFLVKMTNITDVAKPYVAVGVDSRKKASSEAMNWLGDESATTIGSNYWANTANEHYPRWQLNVHQVTGQGTQVEQYAADGSEWYAPVGTVTTTEDGTPVTRGWAAAIARGEGMAVEFRVARSDIGLAGIEDGATVTQRFTVASFVNTGVWNNQGGATAEIYGGTSKAVDALGIAPQRPASKPDNDYLLSSWDEDIADGNIDFWVDVAFSKSGVVENQRPSAPSQLVFPAADARLKSSPTFEWKRGSDTDGKVTGYMLEVSTNADFNDLNGTVTLRVNVPAHVTGETDSTKYHYAWSGARQQTMYYWRVRSRDTGGMLSTPASGQFWVDEDGDGPVATLKYVGTDVAGYMAGNYAQQEKLWPESLLSVTDAEIERVVNDSNLKFGFVIEWNDPNGVYATNHLHDGAGANKGKWAWNIASGDGRVSPNWDLVEFHTTLTDRSADTNSFAGLVTDVTGHGEWTTNYWDETGCWGYQWGYDEAFRVGTAGTTDDQTRGANGDSVITNLVRSAFDMHAFDTNVDYYLTVSAEDCTTWKESGYDWWEYGTWKSFKDPSDPDAPGSRYSSGWCADGPNRARNVTTNQLLEIRVRDNDVTAPGASLNRWSTTSFIASTNDATPTFANPEKQLTRESGTGLPTFVTTDGELAGRPLALHFNVYDSSMTGIKLGTAETETVAGLVGSHTMTNSWLVRTQQVGDSEPDVMTNRENYVAAKSTLESSGTGAGTVLTWYWPTMDAENIAHFWATNAVDEGGVLTETVNTLALNLWDLDNNRDGDQMGAETVMGYLKVRDDDTSAPVARDMHTLGTGTNRVVFGLLARWPMATNEATGGRNCSTINEMLTGAVVANGRSGSNPGTLKFFPSFSMWGYENINLGNPQRAVQFPLKADDNAQWESEALSFKFRTTHGGPTNLTVKVQVGSAAERTLGTVQIDKDLDANGDHVTTTNDVTVLFAGADKVTCLAGQTATFRVIADGLETDSSAAQFGEFKVYGVVSLPPGTEVTDQDMRTATWTNSVDVSDGAQGKTDTLRSGLWLAHSAAYTGAAADEPLPKYVLEDASTHEAITNGLTVSGLTAAFENEVADGDFETDFTSPGSEWSLGGGALHVTDATGGNHVLKFTANGATATKVLDLGDVTGATAIRAKCDQVEYKGGRVRLTYVWLDENGDEVEAESAAHSTANNGWEIWVPRNQSVSAANLEAGTVRQLEVTFTREDSSNEADLDDIEVYAEVVTAGGTRTVPATPAVDDFESGTSGWELSDGASVELGGAIRTGSYAVEVSATTDVVQNWVAVTAAEGLLQGSMLGSVWTRGAAAAVEVRFFKTQAETTPLTDWLTVAVPATVDWARTEIPATSADLSETGLTTVYGLVRVRGGGDGATFVDDLEMIVVGWGSPTAGATVENGTKSAALQFTTANLVDGSGKLSLPGGVATLPKDYNFGVQVADYDLDRTKDHLVTTSSGSFRLFDDDATAPQAGMMFGGSLGVRTGDAKAPYAGVGTDVDVRLSDGAMVAAGSSAQIAFDLDFYDFSGWDTLGLSWYPATEAGGAHTLVWTNGSGSMASALKTKGNGEANSPSATNTVTVPVSTLWGLSAVQDAFTTGIVSNWMAATITDKDADRDGDELVWTNKVGMLTFLDDDVKAPKLGSTNRWPRQMFVGKGSVGALAAATNNYADYRRPWPTGTTYADHVPAHERTAVVYDGELRALATENLFIEVDMNDPSDSMKGRSATGLRRGTTKTVSGQANGLGDTYTTTNTWLGLFADSGTNASSYASATPVVDATDKYSSADSTAEDHTKGSLGVMWNVWKWTANLTTNAVATPDPEAVATWLPSGSAYRDLRAVVHAYDADTDRPGDQLESVIVGQVIRVRDDDTVPPVAVGNIMNNGVDITYTGSTLPSRTDPSVKWTNNLSSMTLTFTAATDGAKGADDLNVSGIGGYRLADATPRAATDGTALAYTESAGTVTADLGDSEVTQGLTAEYVFAVDADDDRPGDALAGPGKGFVLAYDITKPTKIGNSASERLVADPDNTDDPTTQFDLTWPISGDGYAVGPDDPNDAAGNYGRIPEKYKTAAPSTVDVLSPWYSYKIYYGTFNEENVPSTDDPSSDTKSYIYNTYVKSGEYKSWASVDVSTNAAADPSAPPNPYASLGSVAATAGLTGKQRVRLYDLEFDQHYAVVIVGVDKAGNEGPAGLYSWATNNTIKFALTQGVVRVRSAINAAVAAGSAVTNSVGQGNITDTNVTHGAVLYWMAAGQTNNPSTHERTGNVSKFYDLIYRDAAGFTTEKGTEQWSMASSQYGVTNSGTSKTNWNYQTDGLEGISRTKLRFYRASYHNRWQTNNPTTGQKQRPLASEEVYSMNRVPLKQGLNFVGLQGVPYTNTLMGLFGTNWPASSRFSGSTRVEFFRMGADGLASVKQYWLMKDATSGVHSWRDTGEADVTDSELPSEFFGYGFSITLPDGEGDLGTFKEFEVEVDGTDKGGMWWYPILQVPTNGPMRNPSAEGWFTKVGNTYTLSEDTSVAAGTTYYARNSTYTEVTNLPANANPKVSGWYETKVKDYVLSEDTSAVSGKTYWQFARGTYSIVTPTAGANPHESGWYEFVWIGHILSQDTEVQGDKAYWTLAGYTYHEVDTSTDGLFSVEVAYGGKREGARSTLISLSLPVAKHVKDLGLVQTNAEGEWEGGFLPGDGFEGDAIYTYDNLTSEPRSIIYYDENEPNPEKRWKTAYGNDLYIRPNDAMVILSMGGKNKKAGSTWTWTYQPSDFYDNPTRWMGH